MQLALELGAKQARFETAEAGVGPCGFFLDQTKGFNQFSEADGFGMGLQIPGCSLFEWLCLQNQLFGAGIRVMQFRWERPVSRESLFQRELFGFA